MSLNFPSDKSALLQLAEAIEEIIFVIQLNQEAVLYVSPECQQILGCVVEELCSPSSSWFSVIHPQERDEITEAWQQHLAGENFDRQYRLLSDNGDRWLHSRFVYLQDEEGENNSIVGIVTDITEQRQSESTLRSFFNSGSMMMGIVELVGNDILHLTDNQKTAEFLGTTPEAMANRLASENGTPQAHIKMWLERYLEAERTAAPVSFEYPHPTPQGIKWLLATVSPISLSPSGRPRFSYIVEDISDRKAAQAQLQENLAREQTLAQLSERMRQTLNLETIFRTTTEEVIPILYNAVQ